MWPISSGDVSYQASATFDLFLNVEFDQVRPISVPLIPGTNGIHAAIVFIRVTFWGES